MQIVSETVNQRLIIQHQHTPSYTTKEQYILNYITITNGTTAILAHNERKQIDNYCKRVLPMEDLWKPLSYQSLNTLKTECICSVTINKNLPLYFDRM